MLFELPDRDALYRALIDRDPTYEGRAWVGVTSTGIFCRLTCPARKPRPENSVFFGSVAECLEAGYRPCKRCRPLDSPGTAEPAVQALLDALDREPARRWREEDVIALGFEPSTVRRAFKRRFGITFLEMARLRRLRAGASSLAGGSAVIDAQQAAGFESASGFREALARVLGLSPTQIARSGRLAADWIDTPIGAMLAVADEQAVHLLEFFERKGLPGELKRLQARYGPVTIGRHGPTDQIADELAGYFGGKRRDFDTPIAQLGSDFTRGVWRALREIPFGETRSYGDIARVVGRPTATRAVARANGANQIAIVVPCHRVIGADGSLTGYGGGRWRKQWLIDHEAGLK